jgi:hypothetical protein
MSLQVDSTRGNGDEWKFLVAFTVPALLVALSCAGARLDPERNQALTFDTVPISDAGLPTEGSNERALRPAPSQPASPVVENPRAPSDAGTAGEPLTCTVDPPDPKPSHTRDWLVYEFTYKDGSVNVHSQKLERIGKPRDSARVMGRYAIELWIGCELVDRVRFGFPLLAAEPAKAPSTRHPLHEPPSFIAHAELRTTVRVPLDLRATRAELVDRGSGQRTVLAWPPNLPKTTSTEPARNAPNSSSPAPAAGSQPPPAQP